MGEIYRTHLSDYKQALEAYSKVANDFPEKNLYVGEGYTDSLADEAQFRIGRLYYENLQDYDSALKAFTKFLDDHPDSCRKAAAYSFIAAIQEQQKDREAAANSVERIIDVIVASDVQSSFFVRDALYDRGRIQEIAQNGFDTIDIIKQLRWKVSQLRDRVVSRQETDGRVNQ
jgi:tetratricopeptide (TPR) repeat protein